MVDLAGEDAGCNVLVGSLGARVVNMIMTPAMFAQIAVVSRGVMGTARNILAWEGIQIHLFLQDVRLREIASMLGIWTKAHSLYLNYRDAVMLDDHCRLMAAMRPDMIYEPRPYLLAVWYFSVFDSFQSDTDEESDEDAENDGSYVLYASSDMFPVDHWVFFTIEFGSALWISLGWTWEDDEYEHLCWRVAPPGLYLSPEEDRARWCAGHAMSDDPAIRVPAVYQYGQQYRMEIGLSFTYDKMRLSINSFQWEADIEPEYREIWSQRARRTAILETADPLDINPIPMLLNGDKGLRRPQQGNTTMNRPGSPRAR